MSPCRADLRHAGRIGLAAGLSAALVGIPPVLGMGMRPWHAFALLALLLAMGGSTSGRLSKLQPSAIDFTALAFVGSLILVDITNSSPLRFQPDVLAAISPGFYFATYVAARLVVDRADAMRAFLIGYLLPAIPTAVIAFGQAIAPDRLRTVNAIAPNEGLERRYASGELIRATGFVGDWTGLGFYLCCAFAAAICLTLLEQQSGRHSKVGTLALWSSALGAVSTVTFSVIITLCVILATFLWLRGAGPGPIAALATGAMAVYWVLGDLVAERLTAQQVAGTTGLPGWVPNTLAFRWVVWTQEALPAISLRPWLGWGSNLYGELSVERRYPTSVEWPSPESQWILTVISYGVLTGALLAVLSLLIVFRLRKVAAHNKAAVPLLALFCCAVIFSLIAPVLTNRGFPAAFWPLLGSVIRTGRERPGRTEANQRSSFRTSPAGGEHVAES